MSKKVKTKWLEEQPILVNIINSKGDLLVGINDNNIDRLPIGDNGQCLMVDNTQTLGVKWDNISSSNLSSYYHPFFWLGS